MSNEYKPVGKTLAQMNHDNSAQFADTATDAATDASATTMWLTQGHRGGQGGSEIHKTLKKAGFQQHSMNTQLGTTKYRLKGASQHEIRLEHSQAGKEPNWTHRNRASNTPFQSAGGGHKALKQYLKKTKFE